MAKQAPDSLEAMRHSLAHIMAASLQQLYPEAKFGVGPVIENGWYYDVDLGGSKLAQDDLAKVEAGMTKLIKANQAFEQFDMPIDEAIAWAKQNGQVYKEELLDDLKKHGTTSAKDLDSKELVEETAGKITTVSFYKMGDFTDLCRGPHVKSTGAVGAYKLTKIAGAYWRGKNSNAMLTRLYGVAFATDKELQDYLKLQDEATKRDHRRLGQELDLYVMSELVGSGLPLFTPRGTVLRDKLNQLSQGLRSQRGFKRVWVPHIGLQKLYETSGHWDKFGDELFLVKSQETDDQFVLKPMNCPHHQQIYAAQQRSYRDLPLKYMETTTIYRDEKSGELHGLSRVRSVTQDDSHIFCTPDQINDVVNELLEITQSFYKAIAMELKIRLSFRDSQDKYLGDSKLWQNAQSILEKAAKANQLNYEIDEGEAAFYGPKIDMIAVDSLGREWQCATIQLDFVQPERFGLEYVDEKSKGQTPVMIHFALLGSIERFLSVFIEHTAGAFPIWLAPEQVRLVTVNNESTSVKFAQKVYTQIADSGIRVELDDSNESVGKKIRSAELMKVPYVLVLGEKEMKDGKFVPRVRADIAVEHADSPVALEQFIQTVVNETKSHVHHSSL